MLGCCRGLRPHGGAHKHSVLPVEGLVHQGDPCRRQHIVGCPPQLHSKPSSSSSNVYFIHTNLICTILTSYILFVYVGIPGAQNVTRCGSDEGEGTDLLASCPRRWWRRWGRPPRSPTGGRWWDTGPPGHRSGSWGARTASTFLSAQRNQSGQSSIKRFSITRFSSFMDFLVHATRWCLSSTACFKVLYYIHQYSDPLMYY